MLERWQNVLFEENSMKKWLLALVLPSVVSCSTVWDTSEEDDFYRITHKEKGEIDSFELPRHAINDVVKGLAFQMLESSSFVNPKHPYSEPWNQ